MKRIFLFLFTFSFIISYANDKGSLSRGNLLEFIENKGQVIDSKENLRPDVLFSGNDAGANIYLRKGGISYVFTQAEGLPEFTRLKSNMMKRGEDYSRIQQIEDSMRSQIKISTQRVDMDFLGADINAKVISETPTEGKFNYYLAHCPRGVTEVSAFKKITYQSIYPNIDACFYGDQSMGLKYDFIVSPGGNPDNIKLKYSGQENIQIINGKILIETRIGKMQEWIPSTYQIINGKKIEVKSVYELNEATINIHVGSYDKTKSLIIDPWTTWITYYGGSAFEFGNSTAPDRLGNVFAAGQTYSTDFPVLAGFQMTGQGNGIYDSYLVKFDIAGNRIWATYFGGTGDDEGHCSATDYNGNVFLSGGTSSWDMPVLSGFQMNNPGQRNAFLAKFDALGILLWSTYYGGTGVDYSTYCATDVAGNIFITGVAQSTNFPVLGGFQMTNGGGPDIFIIKFDSAGNRIWATYYGGSGGEFCLPGIVIDNKNNVAVAGHTTSLDLPVLSGFQMNKAGSTDAFLAKFSNSGALLWATYCGGTNDDWGFGVSADGSGNIFMSGSTISTDFPVQSGFQMTFAGGSGFGDAFAVKFDSLGTRKWATYYGGSAEEEAGRVIADGIGNCFISGGTVSSNFPTSPGACQPGQAFGRDYYLAAFDPNGNRIGATYVGGGGFDDEWNGGFSVFCSYIYLTGSSNGSFPVTPGAFQPTYAGGTGDAIVAQIPKNCTCSESLSVCSFSNNTCYGQCNGSTIATSTGGTTPYSYLWSDGQTTVAATGLCEGTYTVTVTDAINATAIDIVTVSSLPIPVAVIAGNATICAGDTTTLTSSGGISYSWSNGVTSASVLLSPSNTTSYSVIVTDINGCSASDSIIVSVLQTPAVSIGGDTIICSGESTSLVASGSGPYLWNTGSTSSSISVSPSSNTIYTVVANNGFCSDSNAVTVIVNPFPNASAGNDVTINTGVNATLIASGGSVYSWNTGDMSNTIIVSPPYTTTYTVIVTDANGCSDTALVTVFVKPCGPIYIPNSFSPNNDGENDVLYVYGDCIKEMTLVIYNRWGEKVFETTNQSVGWNGNYNNQKENAEVFIYCLKIIMKDESSSTLKQGNISIIK